MTKEQTQPNPSDELPTQQDLSQPMMGQPLYSYILPGTPCQGTPIPTAGIYGQPQQPLQQPQQPVYGQFYQQPVYGMPIQQGEQQDTRQTPPPDEQIKKFVDLVKETADGKADPSKFLSFFNGIDDNFWKGLLIGAGITFVCTSKTVRSVFSSGMGSMFNKSEEMSAEEAEKMEDLKAEQEYEAAKAKTKE